MINKSRALYIFKYLWDHTDEEHPATTADIIQYLASIGISTTRKTVAEDAAELQNSGFDVICNRSRQNEFFIIKNAGGRSAGRQIHLPEKEQGIDRQGDGACKPLSKRYAQTQSLCGRQGQNQQRVRLLCCGHAPRSDPEAKNGMTRI